MACTVARRRSKMVPAPETPGQTQRLLKHQSVVTWELEGGENACRVLRSSHMQSTQKATRNRGFRRPRHLTSSILNRMTLGRTPFSFLRIPLFAVSRSFALSLSLFFLFLSL